MFKTGFLFLVFIALLVASQEENFEIDVAGDGSTTTVPAGGDMTTEAGGVSDSSPSGECEDKITDCKKTAYECTNDQYKPLMCSMCKKTCNLCIAANGTDPCLGVFTVAPPTTAPPTAGPGECIDTATDCAKTAYECKNTLYKPLMCKYCRKTCNLCDDPVCGV